MTVLGLLYLFDVMNETCKTVTSYFKEGNSVSPYLTL